MTTKRNTIVTCAVTGAGLTPSMSPYLPITPDQIAEQSIAAAHAGAAILHLHARNPEDGRPTNDIEVWKQFVPRIRENCDAIINMSASLGATAEDRVSAVLALRPDIATVIVGSMNYGRFKKANDLNITNLKYDWEKEFLFGESAYTTVTQNTFAKIGQMIEIFSDNDIAMEFECYDVGHLYILEYHLNKIKGVKRPLIVQFLTGILGGIPSNVEHLLHMKQTAEKLFGDDLVLFTHGTGPNNMKAAAAGALLGTNVRIGQEDNIQERPGVLFKSNAEQVEKVKRILGELNVATASAAEAREILRM
ncbi:3-keto-5-aminohexanoate cleavage protein [Caballeronia sp. LZ035]|uniref:3-keto-5-aminohexanoate cleavage protein n=1 Tax=Caballeronia sp. LZ035 TaxID=3038568 RepID=UPI002866B2BB|nr:3-keto-5-aminohexanoate cleavage protein [Caballeronia sp. LZ035]MDR5759087.1 3-keto-5-aminohexanoate cleavage protein [Caballeronia sp. LZ035]